MATLIYTVGLPASGKSTLAQRWVAQDPARRARVNRDELRAMMHGGWLGTVEQEQQVTAAQHAAAEALLTAGFDVVVDDTNLIAAHRMAWRELATRCGADVQLWDLTGVPVEVCLERDRHRDRPVGAVVIGLMVERLEAYPLGPEDGTPAPLPDATPPALA